MGSSLVLRRTYILFRNSLMLWGRLVLQRRKDLVSSTNGPTFAVPVMLRIGAALGFSATKCTTQPLGQGTLNEAKTRPGNYSRPNHQSRGNVALEQCATKNTQQFCVRHNHSEDVN